MASSPPKKNTAYTFYTALYSQASPGLFQANPTLAAGDVKIAIDDGAPANLGTLPAVDADFTKRVKVVLTSAEMNGDQITIIWSDQAGDEWTDQFTQITTAAVQMDDLAPTALADAFLNRDMATGTDSGSTTVRTPRQALRMLRNKVSEAGGTITITKEDDSTASWTAAVTRAAANPVSAIDPAGP